MEFSTNEIIKKANKIVSECATRDPYRVAEELVIYDRRCLLWIIL